MKRIEFIKIEGVPLVSRGDNLGRIFCESIKKMGITLSEKDIVVIAQKIVSISEGQIVDLNKIIPTEEARVLAINTGREPNFCQVVIDESEKVIETFGKTIVTKHRLGYTCTSAGIDKSNVKGNDIVSLLPENPDFSAECIRNYIMGNEKKEVAVIISDSFGRADRDGAIGCAIGISGIAALEKKSEVDVYGEEMNSNIALIDEIAAGASIIMGQANQKAAIVLVRGVEYTVDNVTKIGGILK